VFPAWSTGGLVSLASRSTSSVRRLVIFVLSACTGVFAIPMRAQQPTFRGGITLLTVDVTVLDRDGNPVPGLTANDFDVKLDGHVQPVRIVTYEHVAAPAALARPVAGGAPTRETTNAAPAGDPRIFVVLIDDLSMTPSRGKRMIVAADRFIAGLPASDIVGFTTSSGAATVNPTLDHAAVQAAMRHVAGQFNDPRALPPQRNVGIVEALEILAGDESVRSQVIARECFGGRAPTWQELAATANGDCIDEVGRKVRMVGPLAKQTAQTQIDSYVNVISAMRQAPGLKQLLLISDGLGLASREGLRDITPIAHAAAEAGVQVSVLVEEPDAAVATDLDPGAAGARRDDNLALMNSIQTVADITGGRFYRVVGTPDPSFARVAAASSAVYRLGVDAPEGSLPGRDFALSASVRRPGVTVHANRHAVAPEPAVAVPVDDQLRAAVAKGLPFYGVPIAVATMLRRGDTPGGLDLAANVEVPAATPGPLSVVFGLVDANGTLRTGRKTVAAPADGGNYRLSLSLPVTAGAYKLRFAVADAGGRVGSIESGVSAQLGHVGPFLASDVLTSWSGPDGKLQLLALEHLPSAAVAVRAFLELYRTPNAPAASNVQVQWALLDSGARKLDERVVGTTGTGETLTANTQFALGPLASGTYTIRATVLVAGTAVGTVSTTIRKG